MSLCKLNKLEFRSTARKQRFFETVLYALVDAELIPEAILDEIPSEAESLKITEAKAEIIKAESEARLKNAEAVEIETRARLMSEAQPTQRSHGQQLSVFDPTKHVRLVPSFQGEDLDSFYQKHLSTTQNH